MAREVVVKIVGDTSNLQRSLGKTQSTFSKFGRAAGIAGAAIAGGLAVGLEQSVKAALIAQKATARLDTSFKDAGLSARLYASQIAKAEASGRKLGFTDEDTKTALGSLVTATKNYAQAAKDMAVAQDVARFKGIGLEDATKMVTMAMTGSQRAAKQLGISVPPVTASFDALGKSADAATKAHAKFVDKQATGQAVIDAVSAHLHGQAQAFSQTAAGGMEQFRAQLEHLEVSLGTALLPALASVSAELGRVTDFMSRHTKAVQIGAAAAAVLATTLLTVSVAEKTFRAATLAATAAQVAFDIAARANPYVAVATALLALGGATVIAYKRSATFRAIVDQLYSSISAVASAIRNHWQIALATLVPVIGPVTVGIIHLIGPMKTLYGWVMSVVHAVEALISALGRIHVPHIHLPGLPHVPGLASGVKSFSGGMALVGERGPELVNLPGGSSVTPNRALGGVVNYNFSFPNYVGSKQQLMNLLRNEARLFQNRTGRPAFG